MVRMNVGFGYGDERLSNSILFLNRVCYTLKGSNKSKNEVTSLERYLRREE